MSHGIFLVSGRVGALPWEDTNPEGRSPEGQAQSKRCEGGTRRPRGSSDLGSPELEAHRDSCRGRRRAHERKLGEAGVAPGTRLRAEKQVHLLVALQVGVAHLKTRELGAIGLLQVRCQLTDTKSEIGTDTVQSSADPAVGAK